MTTKKRRGSSKEEPPRLPSSGLAEEILRSLGRWPPQGGEEVAVEAARAAVPAAGGIGEEAATPLEEVYAFVDALDKAERTPQEKPEEPKVWVTFGLGRETFALLVAPIREVTRVNSITRVPHAPFPIRGIFTVRGQVLPVLDLGLCLGLPAAEITEASRVVVIDSSGRTLGLLVDRVGQVVRIRPSAIQPPPEDIRSSHTIYLIGVAELERTLVLLLDLEKVLSFRAGVVGAA